MLSKYISHPKNVFAIFCTHNTIDDHQTFFVFNITSNTILYANIAIYASKSVKLYVFHLFHRIENKNVKNIVYIHTQ